MAEIVNLKGNSVDPDEASRMVIELLEILLTQAKEGKIISIACAWQLRNKDTCLDHTGFANDAITGCVYRLLHLVSER